MIFTTDCWTITWTTSASTSTTSMTPASPYVTYVTTSTSSTAFSQDDQPSYWRPDEETLRRWRIEAATARRRIRQERRINDVTELVLKAGRRRDMTATERLADDEAIEALLIRRPRR